MTVDERLAELRVRYPGRIIDVAPRMVRHDEWTQQGYVATAHTQQRLGWKGGLIWGMGDLGVEVIRPTREIALDALADALAKLEGVTVPRKVALVLALVAAGRWSKMYALRRMMDHWWNVQNDDVAEQIFAALGTTEDAAFEEMKEGG